MKSPLNLFCGVSCELESNLLETVFPLFESGEVDALEWSFDTIKQFRDLPPWFIELLKFFGNQERLIGHGVFFSIFKGIFTKDQENWLDNLEKLTNEFRFDHISEHFGFMSGSDFHKGAPLSIPINSTTLEIAIDRIARIQRTCRCPVGLENLAFSFSAKDVEFQGMFMDRILSEINGFVILDLHNLYCQVKNFQYSFEDLLSYYPLERVREIHISGGSWEDSNKNLGKKIRRDTHDSSVPEEVFSYLAEVISRLPNLRFIILEQLGEGLKSKDNRLQFVRDYKKMKKIVSDFESLDKSGNRNTNNFLPKNPILFDEARQDAQLYKQQMILSEILETSKSSEEIKARLTTSELQNSEWKVEHWDDDMIDTAFALVEKWHR